MLLKLFKFILELLIKFKVKLTVKRILLLLKKSIFKKTILKI